MARGSLEKQTLRNKAEELISTKQGVKLASEETTADNDYKYQRSPNVCGVVVDKSSGRGYVQITGGGKDTEIVHTGRDGDGGYCLLEISEGQSCMLYGRPTVLYILPQT